MFAASRSRRCAGKAAAETYDRVVLTVIAAGLVVWTAALRLAGYRFGRNAIVRCRRGHLFTTIWIPGGSLKALRLGWWRLQFCPVGRHWTIVRPVREADLTDEQRRAAQAVRDLRIP